MSQTIVVLWWISLGFAAVLVLPLMIYLLNRTYRSAEDIRAYTADTLAAAQGLARNLKSTKELERTPDLALRVRDAATGLAAEASALDRGAGGSG